jgi:site-specific recombinase XerD
MPKQRGSTWQTDVSHAGKRIRFGGFGTRAEAEAAEADIRSKLIAGLPIEGYETPERRTLGNLRDLAVEKFWKGTKGERTSVLNADDVVDLLGDVEVKHITHLAIEAMIHRLKDRGCAGATVNRKLAALSKMLRLAETRGWISKVPTIHRQKESEHRIRYLSVSEECQVLNWFYTTGNLDMHSLIEFLIDTGVRLSEALEARWDAFEGEWLALYDTKNGGHRRVPMTPRAKRAFESRPKDSPRPWNLTVSQCDYYWGRMREHLGLENDSQFVIHSLRHTFASRLVQRGVELQVVAKLLGHRSILTTMRYAHLAPQNLADAVKVLSGAEFVGLRLQSQTPTQAQTAVPG